MAGWDLGLADHERLLKEAAEFKGESLWSDAWRRLGHNRPAWWCMIFLAACIFLSLLAPLLPLRPPGQLNPRPEPTAPVVPWGETFFTKDYDAKQWEDLGRFDTWALSVREAIFGEYQNGPLDGD